MARPEVTGKKLGPNSIDNAEPFICTKEFCILLDDIHPHTLMRRMRRDPSFPQPNSNIRKNGYHWPLSEAQKYRDLRVPKAR